MSNETFPLTFNPAYQTELDSLRLDEPKTELTKKIVSIAEFHAGTLRDVLAYPVTTLAPALFRWYQVLGEAPKTEEIPKYSHYLQDMERFQTVPIVLWTSFVYFANNYIRLLGETGLQLNNKIASSQRPIEELVIPELLPEFTKTPSYQPIKRVEEGRERRDPNTSLSDQQFEEIFGEKFNTEALRLLPKTYALLRDMPKEERDILLMFVSQAHTINNSGAGTTTYDGHLFEIVSNEVHPTVALAGALLISTITLDTMIDAQSKPPYYYPHVSDYLELRRLILVHYQTQIVTLPIGDAPDSVFKLVKGLGDKLELTIEELNSRVFS